MKNALDPPSCEIFQNQRQERAHVEMMQSVEEEKDTPGLMVGMVSDLPPPDGDCDQSQTWGAGYEGMDRDMAEEGIQDRYLPFEMLHVEVVQG